jgi:hypothetical protein
MVNQSKFHNISIKWSKTYVILTQTAYYCDITSATGQTFLQMANKNVI